MSFPIRLGEKRTNPKRIVQYPNPNRLRNKVFEFESKFDGYAQNIIQIHILWIVLNWDNILSKNPYCPFNNPIRSDFQKYQKDNYNKVITEKFIMKSVL